MFAQLLPALRITLLLTLLTGVIYPILVTGVCRLIFPSQSAGRLIRHNGQIVGSSLIGQSFTRPEYFHGRPSAAGNDGYDATASGASNLSLTSQKLFDRLHTAAGQYRTENPGYTGPIPADALTSSASGLDPEISLANAEIQIVRVAKARGVESSQVHELVAQATQSRTFGLWGEPRVNVLQLNLALDSQFPKRAR